MRTKPTQKNRNEDKQEEQDGCGDQHPYDPPANRSVGIFQPFVDKGDEQLFKENVPKAPPPSDFHEGTQGR